MSALSVDLFDSQGRRRTRHYAVGALGISKRALRIEKAFGVSMDTFMRMQNSSDIAEACKREGYINVPRCTGKRSEPQSHLI